MEKCWDRLNVSKIKVIQQESDLADDVFTGEQSAVVFVEDLRVGDVLEYAYTVRGANPVFQGHYSAKFTIQSGVSVDRQRFRLIWTGTKPLFINSAATDVQVTKNPWKGGAEYIWDFSNLEAIPYEDYLPIGFNPYPVLEFSDFQNWAEVVKWAAPLYEVEKTNAAA